jgi:hypothetical protein
MNPMKPKNPNLNPTKLNHLLGEPLIDGHQAALMFNLPAYWLSHACERQQRRIPHYRVNKLVRFKATELDAWVAAQPSGAQQPGPEEAADA